MTSTAHLGSTAGTALGFLMCVLALPVANRGNPLGLVTALAAVAVFFRAGGAVTRRLGPIR